MGYRKNEPHEEFLADECPALEKELIQTHLDDLGYSRQDVCTLLDLDEPELDEILGTKKPLNLRIVE